MSFTKEIKDDAMIIRINQERFDSNIAPEVKAEILMVVDQGQNNILIDLTKVVYTDSSGLGALLFGLRQVRNMGGALRVFGANNRVQNLIRIAKLEQVLLNFENEQDALKSFE